MGLYIPKACLCRGADGEWLVPQACLLRAAERHRLAEEELRGGRNKEFTINLVNDRTSTAAAFVAEHADDADGVAAAHAAATIPPPTERVIHQSDGTTITLVDARVPAPGPNPFPPWHPIGLTQDAMDAAVRVSRIEHHHKPMLNDLSGDGGDVTPTTFINPLSGRPTTTGGLPAQGVLPRRGVKSSFNRGAGSADVPMQNAPVRVTTTGGLRNAAAALPEAVPEDSRRFSTNDLLGLRGLGIADDSTLHAQHEADDVHRGGGGGGGGSGGEFAVASQSQMRNVTPAIQAVVEGRRQQNNKRHNRHQQSEQSTGRGNGTNNGSSNGRYGSVRSNATSIGGDDHEQYLAMWDNAALKNVKLKKIKGVPLGFLFSTSTGGVASDNDANAKLLGMKVTTVVNEPAQSCLQQDDLIVEINGHHITSLSFSDVEHFLTTVGVITMKLKRPEQNRLNSRSSSRSSSAPSRGSSVDTLNGSPIDSIEFYDVHGQQRILSSTPGVAIAPDGSASFITMAENIPENYPSPY